MNSINAGRECRETFVFFLVCSPSVRPSVRCGFSSEIQIVCGCDRQPRSSVHECRCVKVTCYIRVSTEGASGGRRPFDQRSTPFEPDVACFPFTSQMQLEERRREEHQTSSPTQTQYVPQRRGSLFNPVSIIVCSPPI